MKDDKIQTGLRISSSRYDELKEIAERSGISLNAVILFLVDVGLTTVNLGIEATAHSVLHNLKQIDEQHAPQDC